MMTTNEFQIIANSLKYGYVFETVNSGQMWLPEKISFRFVYENKEEFVKIISNFIDLRQSTEEIRNKSSFSFGEESACVEFKEFINPVNQKIKGLENDMSNYSVSCNFGNFEIDIAGVGKTAGDLVFVENLETALKIENLIELYNIQEYIDHSIGTYPNSIKK